MSMLSLAVVCLMGAQEAEIDQFRFRSAAAAREIWVSQEGTMPVAVVDDGGRPVLAVKAPFETHTSLGRIVIDRHVELDLAMAGEFTLEIDCDIPAAAGQITLYFRSGDGWYGGSAELTKRGWQTVRFSKSKFRVEGRPSGWHKIDRIRIAAWRGQARDAILRIRRLAALWHEVVVVMSDRVVDNDEGQTQTTQRVAGMLAELGLGADAVDEESICRGALRRRRVAILAHNPRLNDQTVVALQEFVEDGGKLLVCYQLPERLGKVLGFGYPRYFRQSTPGQFAEMRFRTGRTPGKRIPGLPSSVRQDSWNIMTAQPTGHNARTIGHWFDASGKPTGKPAMLVSDRGAFLSHIVLGDDRSGKKELLAALLGHLAPELSKQMSDAALDAAGRIGHHEQLRDVVQQVETSHSLRGKQLLNEALKKLDVARREAENIDSRHQAIRLARETRALLSEAYERSQPSRSPEGRAFWNHSGTGAYPGDWDRSARELADAGFNMVLPNLLWAGRAHYPSNVLPHSRTLAQYGDQVAQCIAACKQHGIEVHVWKVNFNLLGAPKSFVERMRREGRLQRFVSGETRPWLCPSHPENFRLELASMIEVARRYPIDGLHFDYIRFPGRDSCYCDGCRERFELASRSKVASWPDDCYNGPRRKEYNDWRCDQITRLVEAVHREGKRLRSELMISAAVFGSYPACRASVGQDWPKWVEAGYLDFICPMDYTNSDLVFQSLVEGQLRRVGGRIPVYAGIGATASNASLTADRVVGQIHHARRLGAAGFTIFNFSEGTARSILPGVGLGVGTRKATLPHQD